MQSTISLQNREIFLYFMETELILLNNPNAQETHAQRRARRRNVVNLVRTYQQLLVEVVPFAIPPPDLNPHLVFQKMQGEQGKYLLDALEASVNGLQEAKARMITTLAINQGVNL